MIFKYGTYQHTQDEVTLEITKRPEYTSTGYRKGIVESWRVRGVLHATTQVLLTTALQDLEDAYSVDGLDAVLLDNSSVETAHKLVSANALGGVRVADGINYPEGGGAEYAAGTSAPGRTYEIILEAFFPKAFPGLLSFRETISHVGTTGPRFLFLQTLQGAPVRQQVAAQTTLQIIQQGQAVGYDFWPTIPSPLFPADEHVDQRRLERVGPDLSRNQFREYPVSWSYVFESASPLSGIPNFGA